VNTLNVDDTGFSSRRNRSREKAGRKALADLAREIHPIFDCRVSVSAILKP